jgi:hypothetical protein
MAQAKRGETYGRLKRWVDKDLAAGWPVRRPLALYGPFCAAGFVGIGAYNAGSFAGFAVALFWWVIVPLWAIWTAFVLWRASRLMRAVTLRSDRLYDRGGKYLLPPEYAATESLTAIHRRARQIKRCYGPTKSPE